MQRYNLQSNCNQSLSWVDNSAELKSESKRELRLEDYTLQPEKFQEKSEDLNHFQDLDFDLETPQGGDGVMPVFALPPPPGSKGKGFLFFFKIYNLKNSYRLIMFPFQIKIARCA